MNSVSPVSVSSRKSVDFASDSLSAIPTKDLKRLVEEEKASQRLLMLENKVLEKYLTQNFVQSMSNMHQVLELVRMRSLDWGSLARDKSERRQSSMSRGSFTGNLSLRPSSSETSSRATTSYDELRSGFIRTSYNFRAELVQKAIDEKEIELDHQKIVWKREKRRYRQEIEQAEVTVDFLNDIIDRFDQGLLAAVNPITSRHEGDKVQKIIENSLREIDLKIEKARLQCNFLRTRLQKVKSQLAEKGELGERIYPIDFQLMQINQMESQKKLDIRNQELLIMKKIAGETLFFVGLDKKFMIQQLKDIESTKRKICVTIKTGREYEDLRLKVLQEERNAFRTLRKLRDMKNNYCAPSLDLYIEKRCELQELVKQIKVWTRRKQLLFAKLKVARLQLKKATGKSRLPTTKKQSQCFDEMNLYFHNMQRELERLESSVQR